MNRRITKSMAEEAASCMKKKAYAKKIDEAKEKIDQAIEALVRKYIPAPVIAFTNEFSTYIEYCEAASITAIKRHPDGVTTKQLSIGGKLTFKIPRYCNYITVEAKEYDAVRNLLNTKNFILKVSEDFEQQVFDALIALRTEKNVEKELPEAMKYLRFPEVKSVPMPVFTGLRDIIGKIKED